MSFTFKHPKYYKELRARNKSDQAISDECATAPRERSPGPGQSLTRDSNADGGEGSSDKQRDSQVVNQVKLSSQSQASGLKLQATSSKHQASSRKRLEAPSAKLK